MCGALDEAISADEEQVEVSGRFTIGGRGARRVDNLLLLGDEVGQAVKDAQRLAARTKIQRDFSGAAALDESIKELTSALAVLVRSTTLSADHQKNSFADMGERVARDGTSFITSDYLFLFPFVTSSGELHTIGSIAVAAGCGSVLRSIREKWPGFTALGVLPAIDTIASAMVSVSSKSKATVNFGSVDELRRCVIVCLINIRS